MPCGGSSFLLVLHFCRRTNRKLLLRHFFAPSPPPLSLLVVRKGKKRQTQQPPPQPPGDSFSPQIRWLAGLDDWVRASNMSSAWVQKGFLSGFPTATSRLEFLSTESRETFPKIVFAREKLRPRKYFYYNAFFFFDLSEVNFERTRDYLNERRIILIGGGGRSVKYLTI